VTAVVALTSPRTRAARWATGFRVEARVVVWGGRCRPWSCLQVRSFGNGTGGAFR